MEHSKITTRLAKVCRDACPVCKKAREDGKGIIHSFVKIEGKICPACRSYKKVYGVPSCEKPANNQG